MKRADVPDEFRWWQTPAEKRAAAKEENHEEREAS